MTTIIVVSLLLMVPVAVVVATAPRGVRHRTLLAMAVGPDTALALRTQMRCDRKRQTVEHPEGWSLEAGSVDDYRWMCQRLLLDGALPFVPTR